jgi:5'-AMP-activated protein kinase catalytic alpha subunit
MNYERSPILREPSGRILREPSGRILREPSGTILREPSGRILRAETSDFMSKIEMYREMTQDICKMSFEEFKNFAISSKKIGEGSYAKVFEGLNNLTGERIAVKVIDLERIKNDNEQGGNILNECYILKRLHHPNIVKSYGSYLDENTGKIYWFLELLEGGELIDYLSKYSYNLIDVMNIFVQLLQAVKHCHDNNVIHRDIKLENIVLKHRLDLKQNVLIDFGFSTVQAMDDPLLTDYPGSLLYAAPELINGIPYVGRKVDIYAMGVCLYMMIFKKQLNSGYVDDESLLFYQTAYTNFPKEIISLLRGMLRHDPNKRFDIYNIEKKVNNIMISFGPSFNPEDEEFDTSFRPEDEEFDTSFILDENFGTSFNPEYEDFDTSFQT